MDNEAIKRHLFTAVHVLASGEGTVDVRLRKIYESELHQLSSESLPARIQQDYEQLMADLSRLFDGQAIVDRGRASLLAQRVVVLYEQMIEER